MLIPANTTFFSVEEIDYIKCEQHSARNNNFPMYHISHIAKDVPRVRISFSLLRDNHFPFFEEKKCVIRLT